MATETDYDATPVVATNGATPFGRTVLALLRLVAGFYFLWAFLDKCFGLGYSTPSERAWIHGGSPTSGFLGNVHVGPFASMYRSMAGNAIFDWLFMLGLLCIGVAVFLGAGMWLGAWSGTVLLLLMWTAVWPPATTLDDGTPRSSTNPFVDDHIILALALLVLAAFHAGRYFGLGRWWEGVVGKNSWLV